jgi:hypothetical protein
MSKQACSWVTNRWNCEGKIQVSILLLLWNHIWIWKCVWKGWGKYVKENQYHSMKKQTTSMFILKCSPGPPNSNMRPFIKLKITHEITSYCSACIMQVNNVWWLDSCDSHAPGIVGSHARTGNQPGHEGEELLGVVLVTGDEKRCVSIVVGHAHSRYRRSLNKHPVGWSDRCWLIVKARLAETWCLLRPLPCPAQTRGLGQPCLREPFPRPRGFIGSLFFTILFGSP